MYLTSIILPLPHIEQALDNNTSNKVARIPLIPSSMQKKLMSTLFLWSNSFILALGARDPELRSPKVEV